MITADDSGIQNGHRAELLSPARLPVSLSDSGLGEAARPPPVVENYGLPSILLAGLEISAEVLTALPRSFVLEHHVMPFAHAQGRLRVAISDPLALDIIDGLNYVAGLSSLLEPFLILFLALIVGTIVVALFLPIVRIVQLLT